jgi:type IV secretory pathway TraG/TraD family ATPase VirD4
MVVKGNCNRPIHKSILATGVFCAVLFQAFWGLLAVHFLDMTDSENPRPSNRQLSLAEFFNLKRTSTLILTITCAICLIGIFISDVIGLDLIYSNAAELICDDEVQTNAAINLWSSFCIIVGVVLWMFNYMCCSRPSR